MKVLRNAVTEKATSKRVVCQTCTSELEITKEDVTYFSDHRDGDGFTFTCPPCGRRNYIDAALLPRLWRLSSK